MKILIYGINYAPELTGIGKYTGEMAEWMVQQGHNVSVITSMPYYPEWETHKNYKGKWWHTEVINNVTVHRCPMYVPKKVTSVKRILHEFSFILSSLVYWLKLLFTNKADVVISIAPPFHLGFTATVYSKLKKVKLITHIQDLQVDAAKDLGMIKNKSFLSIMFKAEKYLLDKSSIVSTISEGMLKKVYGKSISKEKTILFPNWVDESIIYPLSKDSSLRKSMGFDDQDKIILYSGNLGEKQGLEILIEAAHYFLPQKDIKFLIVGSGGGKSKLESAVAKGQLLNVYFKPLQPYLQLSALLATADIHLVLQKKSAADLVMPSKLTSILAAGGYALVTALPGTTLHDVITEHQIGQLLEPESTNDLINAINFALTNNNEGVKKNARYYAEKFLSKEHVLKNFENELSKLIS